MIYSNHQTDLQAVCILHGKYVQEQCLMLRTCQWEERKHTYCSRILQSLGVSWHLVAVPWAMLRPSFMCLKPSLPLLEFLPGNCKEPELNEFKMGLGEIGFIAHWPSSISADDHLYHPLPGWASEIDGSAPAVSISPGKDSEGKMPPAPSPASQCPHIKLTRSLVMFRVRGSTRDREHLYCILPFSPYSSSLLPLSPYSSSLLPFSAARN